MQGRGNIYETDDVDDSFDFQRLSLAHPVSLSGGTFFAKIECHRKPLYVQTAKCNTRQGFVKSGKKMYADLMFDKHAEHTILWFEKLEARCQQLIYDKRDTWFQSTPPLEKSDIESAFTPIVRIYKSGKNYLVRGNVKTNTSTGIPLLKVYDEAQRPVPMEDISGNQVLICILEIQGIKFSARNFQVEIELKQCMVMRDEDSLFEECLIHTTNNTASTATQFVKLSADLPAMSAAAAATTTTLSTDANFPPPPFTLELGWNEEMPPSTVLPTVATEETLRVPGELHQGRSQIEPDATKEVEGVGEDVKPVENINIAEDMKTVEDINIAEDINTAEEVQIVDVQERETATQESMVLTPSLLLEVEDLTPSEELVEMSVADSDLLHNHGSLAGDISLKKPTDIYMELYRQAREKAKEAKRQALVAFLEAKQIKDTYLVEHSFDGSDSEFEEELDAMQESASLRPPVSLSRAVGDGSVAKEMQR